MMANSSHFTFIVLPTDIFKGFYPVLMQKDISGATQVSYALTPYSSILPDISICKQRI